MCSSSTANPDARRSCEKYNTIIGMVNNEQMRATRTLHRSDADDDLTRLDSLKGRVPSETSLRFSAPLSVPAGASFRRLAPLLLLRALEPLLLARFRPLLLVVGPTPPPPTATMAMGLAIIISAAAAASLAALFAAALVDGAGFACFAGCVAFPLRGSASPPVSASQSIVSACASNATIPAPCAYHSGGGGCAADDDDDDDDTGWTATDEEPVKSGCC